MSKAREEFPESKRELALPLDAAELAKYSSEGKQSLGWARRNPTLEGTLGGAVIIS